MTERIKIKDVLEEESTITKELKTENDFNVVKKRKRIFFKNVL